MLSVPDIVPEMGPLGGIHTALKASYTEWTLVVPCDMPLLTQSVISELFRSKQNADVVCFRSVEGLQPFPMLVNRSQAALTAQLLTKKQNSVHRFVYSAKSNIIPLNSTAGITGQMLQSFNTPEQLEQIISRI